jgi:hypothetical protein
MNGPALAIRLSVIVPAFNNARYLVQCLTALRDARPPAAELIVVDDASTDDTPAVAAAAGASVLTMSRNGGPGAARNYGAQRARGEVLLFVDADVVVASGTLSRVERAFAADPALGALFGSYDDDPQSPELVSRYRNLLHHFVHQEGDPDAGTFWAGLGAVRRPVFLAVGGFDGARFPRPSIEDIELGYRIRRAGHRIRLDRELQGKHLKRWGLWSMVRTDVTCRALPWGRLLMRTAPSTADLNLGASQRVSAVLTGLALAAAVLALQWSGLLAVSGLALAGVALLNRRFYALLWRRGGARLAGAGFALHLLYFVYSAASFAYVWLEARVGAEDPAERAGR